MKIFANSIYILTTVALFACNAKVTVEADSDVEKMEAEETVFDEALAERLGADEYGMRMYVMAFLKEGPNRDLATPVNQVFSYTIE